MSVLENSGMTHVNWDADKVKRVDTVCVTGLPRSGTSLVASALHHLGIFLGDDAHPPTYEDSALRLAFDGGDLDEFGRIARSYGRDRPLWAFKLPRVTYRVEEAVEQLSHPAMIITFRDPLSVQLRKSISQGDAHFFKGMKSTADAYRRLAVRLARLDIPMFLVAYDKAAVRPEVLVAELAKICGVADSHVIESALTRIAGDKTRYLDQARVNKAYGVVESAKGCTLTGWAIHQFPHDKNPPIIQVLDGDEIVMEQPVSIRRRDVGRLSQTKLDALGIRPEFLHRNLRKFDGIIGFRIKVPRETASRSKLRVKGDYLPFYP